MDKLIYSSIDDQYQYKVINNILYFTKLDDDSELNLSFESFDGFSELGEIDIYENKTLFYVGGADNCEEPIVLIKGQHYLEIREIISMANSQWVTNLVEATK